MKVFEISQALFKRDSKGKIRVWNYETGYDENGRWGWRTISGLQDGKKVTSEWTMVEEKNVGRSNATTLEMQAGAEAHAEYTKKLDSGYFRRLEDVDTFTKFKPMLAENFDDFDGEFPVYSQPKLDGIRCIARKDGLWTREGKPIVSVPHIVSHLKAHFDKYPNHVIDGELYNHALKDDFNTIASMVRKEKLTQEDLEKTEALVEYHVYDCYIPDTPDLAFRKRELLRWGVHGGPVHIVSTMRVETRASLDALYEGYLEHGYEGQMVRKDTKYENKRTKNLMKRKEFLSAEFPVKELVEGLGNWSGKVKRFTLTLEDGREFGAGVRGKQEVLAKLLKGPKPDWATVRYFTPTPDGIPRFPVVTDWGYGKRED